MDTSRIEGLIRELLEAIGEDPNREGLEKTPERVARAWEFLTSGYRMSVDEIAAHMHDASPPQNAASNMIANIRQALDPNHTIAPGRYSL